MGIEFFKSEFAKSSKFKWDFLTEFKEQERWEFLSNNYQRFLMKDFKLDNHLKIPKIIHHIWVGNKKLPKKYKNWINSWKKFNPDWEFIFWKEDDIQSLDLKNKKIYNACNNPGFKSDVARYEILNKFGGLYLDVDFECINYIPEKLLTYDFVACTTFNSQPEINNAILFSSPNNIFLEKIIDSIKLPPKNYSFEDIFLSSGPYLLTEIYFKNIDLTSKKTLILPSNYFYPFPNFLLGNNSFSRKSMITIDTVGIHHWGRSWMKKNLIKRIMDKLNFFIIKFTSIIFPT